MNRSQRRQQERAKKKAQKGGSFQMEIVPSKNIDVEKIFKDTIADLYEKFGEKILEIDIKGITPDSSRGMHQ